MTPSASIARTDGIFRWMIPIAPPLASHKISPAGLVRNHIQIDEARQDEGDKEGGESAFSKNSRTKSQKPHLARSFIR
jgi:hypothetical protein